MFTDVEKLSKMKKLLDILSTPSKRMPLETLLKCEVVLEKLDLKRVSVSAGVFEKAACRMVQLHIF
jgi:mediator of RNA polymerase II transcription subunit 15